MYQINPRNPHSHTNVIRNKEGNFVIIDLESAVATPFPAPGQWRSSFKWRSLPIFDDIDFVRLRRYVEEQGSALRESLGDQGLADLRVAVDGAEEALLAWQRAEPRVWSRIIRTTYRLLNWKAGLQHLLYALDGANRASERLLNRGIARWEAANGMSPAEADSMRQKLTSREAKVRSTTWERTSS